MLVSFKRDLMQIDWEIKHFNSLSTKELHDILKLRVDVFVIEQNCPYPEVDGIDPYCCHVLCKNESNELVGTARIVPPKKIFSEYSIGRVVIAMPYRKQSLGKQLMTQCISYIHQHLSPDATIRIAALKYLEIFYQSFQFVSIKEYREWEYDYVEMLRF